MWRPRPIEPTKPHRTAKQAQTSYHGEAHQSGNAHGTKVTVRRIDEPGLDDYEVRGWRGWHHHMTLVMLAHWFLVLQKRRLGQKTETGMTLPDVRRLLQVIFAPETPKNPDQHAIDLSDWRQQRN